MDKVRLIGIRSEYKDLGVDIVILLPPKPPSKVRFRKQKDKELLNNDEMFMPFSDDEDNNGAPAVVIPDGENIEVEDNGEPILANENELESQPEVEQALDGDESVGESVNGAS